MHIRSYSWGEANISWSVVIEELLFAAENMGHDVSFVSTNGYTGMKYWTGAKGLEQDMKQRQFIRNGGRYDLDLTYTVPQNFPQRFRSDSRRKMAIYAYESSIMPANWKNFYYLVDYMLPPSEYVAEMMVRNGCPKDKIVVVPHGVDTNVFNPDVKPLKLGTDKKVKFLCVAEPHYRKQLDKLLRLFCERFTNEDDIALILKTKLFKPGEEIKGFEMDLKPVLLELKKEFGSQMPEIKIISKRLNNIAGLYTACDAFVLMTASEGWGVPYLEALACGLPVIAPRHGGQLQFLNDGNAILTNCGVRKARVQEQYWQPHPDALVGSPDEEAFGAAMQQVYYDLGGIQLKDRSEGIVTVSHRYMKEKYEQMRQAGLETARQLTWENAMQQILDLSNA